jgi:8-oxo-dGTP diphosphatase
MKGKFNVRVYGILLNELGQVLLSKEHYKDLVLVKFPGGGMEYGEGTLDTLKREFEEELGVSPIAFEHFYTTDFFQKSVLDESQILSIYYLVQLPQGVVIPACSDTGSLFFHTIAESLLDVINLPIDKVAASMLIERYKK